MVFYAVKISVKQNAFQCSVLPARPLKKLVGRGKNNGFAPGAIIVEIDGKGIIALKSPNGIKGLPASCAIIRAGFVFYGKSAFQFCKFIIRSMGFINESQESAEPLILTLYGYAGYNADEQVVGYAQAHLRPNGHIKIPTLHGFIEFHPDKIAGTRNHVMKIAVDLPFGFPVICSKMLKISSCAFSISSKSTTEYGCILTRSVSCPPSS